jgi:Transcriptional regulator/sugar kinase
MKKVLVIDIGGTTVKLMISRNQKRKFDSGMTLSPGAIVRNIRKITSDWEYDVASVGFPAPVREGKITKNPKHLHAGWAGYDFAKALGKPVKIINDAAMQALGSYRGGRMLFLGLGTGLGSALVWKDTVLSLELGDLPYGDGGIIEDHLGKPGFEWLGKKEWQREVPRAVAQLKLSFIADYVVLGGGNAKLVEKLPAGVELGHNRNAFLGGTRLWQTKPHSRKLRWQVL